MQFWKAGFNVSGEKPNLKLDRRGESLRFSRSDLDINPVMENLPFYCFEIIWKMILIRYKVIHKK
jgi:hypothetical protein